MAYAIRYQTAECRSADGTRITQFGQWHWIINEPDGWVWASSMSDLTGALNQGVKVFKTKEAAEKACKTWEKEFHPWYGKPNGVYEIVKIEPIMVTIQQGWRRSE